MTRKMESKLSFNNEKERFYVYLSEEPHSHSVNRERGDNKV